MNPWDLQYADVPTDATAPAVPQKQKPWEMYGETPAASPADANMPWSDVAGQAVTNLPSSAAKLGTDLYNVARHPLDTGKALFNVAVGGASKLENALGVPTGQSPEKRAQDEATLNALAGSYKKNYGSIEGFKHHLAEDPLSVAMDVSTIASPVGGALRAGGTALTRVAPRVGAAVSDLGGGFRDLSHLSNPVNAGIEGTKFIGRRAADSMGVLTGAGELPFTEAFDAARQPGGSKAFLDAFRGKSSPSAAVDDLKGAISDIADERRSNYTANMASTKSNWSPMNLQPVDAALGKAAQEIAPNGFVKSDEALDTLNKIQKKVDEFKSVGLTHADAVDGLKQAIWEIENKAPFGSLERKVAGNIRNSVKGELLKQNPDYAGAMQNYQDASNLLDNLKRTFSAGDKAAEDTTLRKLQSVMRNNVSTNYGRRTQLMRDEIASRRPDIMPMLAGATLNTAAPRGLSRLGAQGGALGTLIAAIGTGNPHFLYSLAAAPFMSPKVMGATSYAAGRMQGVAERALARAGITADTAPEIARAGHYAGEALSGGIGPRYDENGNPIDGAFQ